MDNQGEPYLESHHIVFLSEGGSDSIENTMALCPNCYMIMHILKDKYEIEKLVRLWFRFYEEGL